MMLTRCPACQTVFRLHPDQVRARNGEVRCGHCFNPFNALQHRVDATVDGDGGKSTATPAVGGESTPVSAAQRPRAAPAEDALDFELPDFPAFETTDPVPADAPLLPDIGYVREPGTPPAHATGFAPGTRTVPGEAPAPAAPSRSNTPPEVIRSGRRAATDGDDLPPRWKGGEPTATSSDHASGPSTTAHAATPPETEPDAEDIEHLDATYGRPPHRTGPIARTLTGLTVGMLAGALAAQAVFLFRMEISRSVPGLRPLLEAGCTHLGCEVPLPSDIAQIGIETSDLQSEPGKIGRYILYTAVRNRADYPQALPHLELTLTDASDAPVIRRVLTPAEWVGENPPKDSLDAQATIPVRLPFVLEGASPTGYRVYVFYP